MAVTPANRDRLRERAFSLSVQGFGVRDIARRLGCNKDTAAKLVREERQRRSRDRHAEDAIGEVVGVLRASLEDLFRQLRETEGTGPHAAYAKAKLGESIRRTARDLALVYGVDLPKIDGEQIALDRMAAMVQAEIDAPPAGFPDLSEDGILERHGEEVDRRLADLGVIAPGARDDEDDEDFGIWFDGGGGGGVGDSYLD